MAPKAQKRASAAAQCGTATYAGEASGDESDQQEHAAHHGGGGNAYERRLRSAVIEAAIGEDDMVVLVYIQQHDEVLMVSFCNMAGNSVCTDHDFGASGNIDELRNYLAHELRSSSIVDVLDDGSQSVPGKDKIARYHNLTVQLKYRRAEGITFDIARVDLSVVCVGTYPGSEQRACACGQKPLKKVFHLRHMGTGKTLSIGKACAKKFQILGNLETQEAERALRSLEGLQANRSASANEDLVKMARENGLISSAERRILRRQSLSDSDHVTFLKELLVVGLDLARRPSSEFASRLPKPEAVIERRAAMRMAIFKGRADCREWLRSLEPSTITDEDLCIGKLDAKPSGGSGEPESIAALAVKKGFVAEARKLLDAIAWRGAHSLASLCEAVRGGEGSNLVELAKEHFRKEGAEPPNDAIVRIVCNPSQCLDPTCLDSLLDWCARNLGSHAQSLLDLALQETCAYASEKTIHSIIDAGAKDRDGIALRRWCCRIGGGEEATASSSTSVGVGAGARVGTSLVMVAGALPCSAGSQLERNCLHFAAAAGDSDLVQLLLDHRMSPWECTRAPPRKLHGHTELAKGGLHGAKHLLPLEVARRSGNDCSAVECILIERMEEDLRLVCEEEFAPFPPWLNETELKYLRACLCESDVEASRNGYERTRRFGKFVRVLRERPQEAREDALLRRKAAEEHAKAEEERAKAEEERSQREQELRRLHEEQRKAAAETQRKREDEDAQRREQEKPEHLEVVISTGATVLAKGKHAGKTYEHVVVHDRSFANWWVEKGPGKDNSFGRFVEAWRKLSARELASERERRAEACKEGREKMLSKIVATCDRKFRSGKHEGQTYMQVMHSSPDFGKWWLQKGPGEDTDFGRFAQEWLTYSFTRDEVEAAKTCDVEMSVSKTSSTTSHVPQMDKESLDAVVPSSITVDASQVCLGDHRDDGNQATSVGNLGAGDDAHNESDSDDLDAIEEACRLVEAGPNTSDSDDSDAIEEACRSLEARSSRSCGAEPRSIEKSHRLTFGRYKGCSYDEVLRQDPTYCMWARGQNNPSPMMRQFVEFLNNATVGDALAQLVPCHSSPTHLAEGKRLRSETSPPQSPPRKAYRTFDSEAEGPAAHGLDHCHTGATIAEPAATMLLQARPLTNSGANRDAQPAGGILAPLGSAFSTNGQDNADAVSQVPFGTNNVSEHRILGSTVLSVGRHKGRSFEYLATYETGYCSWARGLANPTGQMRDFVEYLVEFNS